MTIPVPAIVGIVCFLLTALPSTPYYYQFPMRIIGKLYANSMLVQINSRMHLGSEETLSTIISSARFDRGDTRQSEESGSSRGLY